MPVTAEGVEDEVILNALRRFKHLKAQGYHFGQPEPAAAVRERLARMGLLAVAPVAAEPGAPAVVEQARKQA